MRLDSPLKIQIHPHGVRPFCRRRTQDGPLFGLSCPVNVGVGVQPGVVGQRPEVLAGGKEAQPVFLFSKGGKNITDGQVFKPKVVAVEQMPGRTLAAVRPEKAVLRHVGIRILGCPHLVGIYFYRIGIAVYCPPGQAVEHINLVAGFELKKGAEFDVFVPENVGKPARESPASVAPPVGVFLRRTVTPGSGSPARSVTRPERVLVCPEIVLAVSRKNRKAKVRCFMADLFGFKK